MAVPGIVSQYAAAHLGLVSRRQLLKDLHFSDAQVEAWRRQGGLLQHCCRVFRLPGVPDLPQQRGLGALLCVGGEDARLSGLEVLRWLGAEVPLRTAPLVLVPPHRRVRTSPVRAGVYRVRRTTVASSDRATVMQQPAVTPLRALADDAALLDRSSLRGLVDELRRANLLRDDQIERRAGQYRRLSGGAAVWSLTRDGSLRQANDGERRMARLLDRFGPGLVYQVEVLPGIRPDALCPSSAMTFEFESRTFHSGMHDIARDLPRTLQQEAEGWHVARLTYDMVLQENRTFGQLDRIRRRRLAHFDQHPQQRPTAWGLRHG